MRDAGLIVIGSVVSEGNVASTYDLARIVLQPEAFLKGSPTRAEITFDFGLPVACGPGVIRVGDRYLVIAARTSGPLSWPAPHGLYLLSGGLAVAVVSSGTVTVPESELIDRIRAQTNQFSQPAAADDGAGIDWVSTVLPVGGALVGLLAVGLVLMRVWHRIDPS